MKHRTKTIETQTNMRCAHLLSGVLWPCLSVTRITSVYCKLCMSESYASKRLYTACFYSNKLFAVIFLSMSVTMHRQCMTSYKSVNHTTKHLSLVRYGHLRCLQWCIIEQICEIISHATCPVYGLVSSSTSSLSSCVKHVMTALSRPGGV